MAMQRGWNHGTVASAHPPHACNNLSCSCNGGSSQTQLVSSAQHTTRPPTGPARLLHSYNNHQLITGHRALVGLPLTIQGRHVTFQGYNRASSVDSAGYMHQRTKPLLQTSSVPAGDTPGSHQAVRLTQNAVGDDDSLFVPESSNAPGLAFNVAASTTGAAAHEPSIAMSRPGVVLHDDAYMSDTPSPVLTPREPGYRHVDPAQLHLQQDVEVWRLNFRDMTRPCECNLCKYTIAKLFREGCRIPSDVSNNEMQEQEGTQEGQAREGSQDNETAEDTVDVYTNRKQLAEEAAKKRRAQNLFLVESREAGMSYKEIREAGEFTEAVSTLRGRYRDVTKDKEARVRNPIWTRQDIELLNEAVNKMLGKHDGGVTSYKRKRRVHFTRSQTARTPAELAKVSWKNVASYIVEHGGSYHFGNTTCKKKWEELHQTTDLTES